MKESITLITTALILLGCLASCRRETARIPYAEDAVLSIGSGGGFTGEYIGYTLERKDGSIYSWRERGGKRISEELLFHAERDSVDFILAALAGTGFDTLHLLSPGNQSYFISLSNTDTTYRVRWGDSRTPVPDTLVGFYAMMVKFIRWHQ